MTDVTQMLADLADEVDRAAKYHRVAVQYGKDTEVDRAIIAATATAVRKIRSRIDSSALL